MGGRAAAVGGGRLNSPWSARLPRGALHISPRRSHLRPGGQQRREGPAHTAQHGCVQQGEPVWQVERQAAPRLLLLLQRRAKGLAGLLAGQQLPEAGLQLQLRHVD